MLQFLSFFWGEGRSCYHSFNKTRVPRGFLQSSVIYNHPKNSKAAVSSSKRLLQSQPLAVLQAMCQHRAEARSPRTSKPSFRTAPAGCTINIWKVQTVPGSLLRFHSQSSLTGQIHPTGRAVSNKQRESGRDTQWGVIILIIYLFL